MDNLRVVTFLSQDDQRIEGLPFWRISVEGGPNAWMTDCRAPNPPPSAEGSGWRSRPGSGLPAMQTNIAAWIVREW